MESNLDLLENYKIFKDNNGNSYVSCEVDDIHYTVRIRSKELRDILSLKAARKGLISIKQTVNKIIEELEAESILATDIEEVNIRYAMRGNAIYIYLGDGDYLVKISDEGVKRTRNKAVRFIHSKLRGKLAYKKEAKGNLELFWKYVPICNEKDRLLFLTFLLNCCFPAVSYTHLTLPTSDLV